MHKSAEFGPLLKTWRQRRRMSQLDLALDAEISSRHVSFLETGRSRPTRAMVLRIAEHLDVPLRERNALLVAAGLSPEYSEGQDGKDTSSDVLSTLCEIVDRMAPMPALIIDGAWNLLAANHMVGLLIAGASAELLKPPINVLRLSLHPDGLAGRIRNLAIWKHHLLERAGRQIANSGDRRLGSLVEELTTYPAPAVDCRETEKPIGRPAVSLELEIDGQLLVFLSTTMVIGGPRDVVLSELAVEIFLPADDATRRWLDAGHERHKA